MFFGAGDHGKGMSKRRMPQGKVRIVLEFLNTGTSAASCVASITSHQLSPKLEGQIHGRWEADVGGIRQESIWKHTPEQNGHMESLHGTFRLEHVWPREFG